MVLVLQSQPRGAAQSPVVVELFTSQGCSSCPPADALLRRIAHDPKLRGRVIPLSFHVDYWNRLGWRDPFSSRQWSQRQADYVRALELDTAYTPQVVVNGTQQMVGSSVFEVYRAIEAESQRQPGGTIRITRTRDGADVRARTQRRDVDLIVVTYDTVAVSTNVTRGENSGKKLVHEGIVRTLVRAPSLEAHVPVAPQRGVAAFLQQRGTMRIIAAAR